MNAAVDTLAFERIASFVKARTGIAFGPSRWIDAERGVKRAMAKAHVDDISSYAVALEAGRISLDDLVMELTVHETYFFRHPAQFAFVRERVLRTLASELGPDHVYRVWSAGCSTGEEAYSLAILLEEEGLANRSHVIATDISRHVLASAREARYRAWSIRGTDQAFALRYLRADGADFTLDDRIRQRVVFRPLNLCRDTYPSPASGVWQNDLILCRNVLIYLDPPAVKAVAVRLFESLAPGGFLVTGPSDPPLGAFAAFETIVTDAGVFYRRGSAMADVAPAIAIWERALAVETTPSNEAFAVETADASAAEEIGADTTDCADVRAEATLHGCEDAERMCKELVEGHPLSIELHYLHTLLLIELGRRDEAVLSAKRVLYLDRTTAAAHFLLGTLLKSQGDVAGARRSYRNARDLCAARPPDEPVAFGEGESQRSLGEAARSELHGIASEAGAQ